ncbi:alpha/beta hydrolase [Sphingobium sp. UBA5915]|jgi:pimeloyl-ACP methyl ester carboxylesterase|uniref:alpha/beta fold hydrolase n=2 Tax=Sphingobium TaxID=165695 RepID=UPI000C39FBB5|nr:alpha/beta hydrolase [Sphingobium sp. UBA5915]MBS48728.1 alpha/beta hydrolase [Sphingobium sp.]MCC4258790.1 alpha/beta hydrolase [Sphingobium lactosutens]MEE2741766.1 alpha/beta hydrolase [Pseudomonadota bacterium]HCW59383.1 alpha/beta hydrolase [Sphingobium sp.]|tara:strand:+ start:11320 stop:12198 length:879 start_codon:yes stop_codon:yes gene_type:complete
MANDTALGNWLTTQWAHTPRAFQVEVEGARIACLGWNMDSVFLPGLVLVHGFRAHARWWDHIAPSFTDRYRVVALNLSGMGDSDRREAYSRAQNGREILAVAAACGFAPFTLVTHSFGTMGGILATKLAPEWIQRLIMIDAGIPTVDEQAHQIPTPPLRIYPDQNSAMARFRLIPDVREPVPAIMEYIARHGVVQTADGWSWKFDHQAAKSLNRERYRHELFGVSVPTDVIYGAESDVMTPERVELALKIAPHAGKPVAIPACNHHVMIEQPLALVAALRGILSNEPARAVR